MLQTVTSTMHNIDEEYLMNQESNKDSRSSVKESSLELKLDVLLVCFVPVEDLSDTLQSFSWLLS